MAYEPEYHLLLQGILAMMKISYHYHPILHVYSQPILIEKLLQSFSPLFSNNK